MFIDLSDLFWLTLLSLAVWHWWAAQRIKELALRAARKHCKEESLQLLDESVSLRAFWLKRDDKGMVRIWRRYHFDFSATGDDRYTGKIIMLGERVTHIELPPHRFYPEQL